MIYFIPGLHPHRPFSIDRRAPPGLHDRQRAQIRIHRPSASIAANLPGTRRFGRAAHSRLFF